MIDAGTAAGPATDQRGATRPIDAGRANAPGSDGTDIGAVEVGTAIARITSAPNAVTADSTPSFEFTADVASSGFECSLDGGGYFPCASPYTTPALADGEHTVSVRAIAPDGVEGPADAATFTIDTAEPSEPAQPQSPPTTSEDDEVADPDVTARKRQRQRGKRIKIKIKAGAGETVTATARGRLKVKGSNRGSSFSGRPRPSTRASNRCCD